MLLMLMMIIIVIIVDEELKHAVIMMEIDTIYTSPLPPDDGYEGVASIAPGT